MLKSAWVALSPNDFSVITGLRLGGERILVNDSFTSTELKKLLDVVPSRMRSNNIPLSWLCENIPLCENVAKSARMFTLLLIGTFFVSGFKQYCEFALLVRVFLFFSQYRTLQLEYLDLYLIHWPITVTPGKREFPLDKQDLMQPWKSARDLALPSPLESATSLVCLRWVYEQGAAPIAKSYNKERLKENQQIFDWELSEDDYDKIGQIKQHRMMPKEELVSAHGPYKSTEELWDGEL
ncbi:hypothetical protein SO802_012379 [Lithocarpus litseifolius]|uniref:NADP-dependent oxidoreductase domain-containing protein n=1 Tax=Lithocarpus litseifolius TaxID=425828 RepID=A0AAW2D2K4_9ROSI